MNVMPLLDKPHVNEVTLKEQNLFLKSCQSYELKLSFSRDLDLFKEVLWISVRQRAAELPAIKVGGRKKILPICQARASRVRTWLTGRIFF